MDLQGKLGAFTLSDILQMLSFSGKTGTLTLIQGWNTRTITFERGRVTYVAAATQLPTHLELLLQAGRLRKAEVEEVRVALLAAVVAGGSGSVTDEQIMRVLRMRGSITPDDVKRCEAQQLERSVYALFLWRDCSFTFEAEILHKQDGIPVSLSSEHIILEGSRRVDEWIELSPLVPSVYTQFMVSPRLNFAELTYEEADVLIQIDGIKDVVAIARATGLTEFDTTKRLFALIQKGIVSAVPIEREHVARLFCHICETIYQRLKLYGYIREANDFVTELNRFAAEHFLYVRMENGKITADDSANTIESNLLLDRYKLFISVQNNRLTRLLSPDVLATLTEGLTINLNPADRRILRMFEWIEIGGLFDESGPWAPRPMAHLRRPVVPLRAYPPKPPQATSTAEPSQSGAPGLSGDPALPLTTADSHAHHPADSHAALPVNTTTTQAPRTSSVQGGAPPLPSSLSPTIPKGDMSQEVPARDKKPGGSIREQLPRP